MLMYNDVYFVKTKQKHMYMLCRVAPFLNFIKALNASYTMCDL